MNSNTIALYKKIDSELIDQAGISVQYTGFKYNNEKNTITHHQENEFNGVIVVNEIDEEWSPADFDLTIKSSFKVENVELLFGEESVAMPTSIIGLAVHLHSRSSMFQKTIDIYEITSKEQKVDYEFEHHFLPGELHGQISIDYFLYLKDVQAANFKQANYPGMILTEGNLNEYLLIVDGDGSSFPMTEFEDREGPLWKLEKNWLDSETDSFNSSNVNLSLNIKHPLFKQIKESKTQLSRALMADIMLQAMSMIITHVKVNEGKDVKADVNDMSGSILSAVTYWVKTFEVDTTDMFTITNSLRSHLSGDLMKGGSEND